jgi:hypothetical protein
MMRSNVFRRYEEVCRCITEETRDKEAKAAFTYLMNCWLTCAVLVERQNSPTDHNSPAETQFASRRREQNCELSFECRGFIH